MKPPHTPRTETPFRASLKHYHRTGSPPETSWNDWVGGTPRRRFRVFPVIAFTAIAITASVVVLLFL